MESFWLQIRPFNTWRDFYFLKNFLRIIDRLDVEFSVGMHKYTKSWSTLRFRVVRPSGIILWLPRWLCTLQRNYIAFILHVHTLAWIGVRMIFPSRLSPVFDSLPTTKTTVPAYMQSDETIAEQKEIQDSLWRRKKIKLFALRASVDLDEVNNENNENKL